MDKTDKEQIETEQKEMPNDKQTKEEPTNDKQTNNNPKKRKKTYNDIMQELLKPPPKEEKPNIHLSGGGQFSKLEKI